MRLSRRVVLVTSALALACYAGLAIAGAARFRHAGGEYLYAAAALLALAAVGLALGDLAARAFAILFFAATSLGYGAVAFVAGRGAFSGGMSDWEGVRSFVLGLLALLALAVCALSLSLAVSLLLLGRAERAPGYQAQTVAWLLGACGVAVIGWILGYQGWYRSMPEQEACLGGGSAARCASLARNEHFSTEEQLAFARKGCERGHAGSCAVLAGRLAKQPVGASPDSQVLKEQCERGNVDVCLRYGTYLLSTAKDAPAAEAAFAKVCTLQVNRCSQAADRADDGGDRALAGRLLEAGCARDDPYSCRALLRWSERAKVADRQALHLKVCLLTDVNECLPLIRRDANAVCPLICDSTAVNRMQSCDSCGREAAAAGDRALAERVWSANCEKGHQLSCVNLGKFLQERPAR